MVPTPLGDEDGEAFESFYRSEIHVLTTLAVSLTGDVERAAEIAQEALLRAYREWPRVVGLDRPGAWVRRVTMNLAIDASRRQRTARRVHGRLMTVETTLPAHEVDDSFWVEVRRLPDRQRMVVALRYVDDMSLEDIGRTMGISVGTVKSALFAARRTLSERLQLEEGHDADVR
jgi:RNA polymerase sigma-70 factor (ECF subfamily)